MINTSITIGIRFVTPDDAERMLGKLYHRQRPINSRHVSRIASDMRKNRFRLSPDPVVISAGGELLNAQHRLRAVIESGTTQLFIVTEGWDVGVYEIMDAGLRRSLAQRVAQSWLKNKNALGTIRATLAGVAAHRATKFSEQAVVAFAIEHEPTFVQLFAMPGAGRIRAGVLGACARALLAGVDPDRVRRFVSIVESGVSSGEHESAAVRLFAWIKEARVQKMNGSAGQTEIYMRTQGALRAFLEGRPLAILRSIESDVWALPPMDGDDEEAGASGDAGRESSVAAA